jgi:hypothetical protein
VWAVGLIGSLPGAWSASAFTRFSSSRAIDSARHLRARSTLLRSVPLMPSDCQSFEKKIWQSPETHAMMLLAFLRSDGVSVVDGHGGGPVDILWATVDVCTGHALSRPGPTCVHRGVDRAHCDRWSEYLEESWRGCGLDSATYGQLVRTGDVESCECYAARLDVAGPSTYRRV